MEWTAHKTKLPEINRGEKRELRKEKHEACIAIPLVSRITIVRIELVVEIVPVQTEQFRVTVRICILFHLYHHPSNTLRVEYYLRPKSLLVASPINIFLMESNITLLCKN